MKTITKLFIFLAFALCYGCIGDDAETIEYNLTAADKALIPFKGDETLLYVSSGGDSLILKGQGYKTTYETKSAGINTNDIEKREILSLNFDVIQNPKDGIAYTVDAIKGFGISAKMNERSYFATSFTDSVGSIAINNKNYDNVCKGSNLIEDSCAMFYVKKIGLVRMISLSDSLTWDFYGIINN